MRNLSPYRGGHLGERETTTPSASNAAHVVLEFRVGEWYVYVGDRLAGENRIERILEGRTLIEDWASAAGIHGHSLFYVAPAESTRTQVRGTEDARGRGGTKEKRRVGVLPGGAPRFQGEVLVPAGLRAQVRR